MGYDDDQRYRTYFELVLQVDDSETREVVELPPVVRQAVYSLVSEFWKAQIDVLGLVAPEYEAGTLFMAFRITRWWLAGLPWSNLIGERDDV